LARFRRSFFARKSPVVARELLGARLVRVRHGRVVSGIIVETEAYRGERDPASHAYRGKTDRNGIMFGPPGHAYVYFSMGVHHCLNVTTEPEGIPAAVLIRALEPVDGVEVMERNRGVGDRLRLTSGPGNLTEAMDIDRGLNGEDLVLSSMLYLDSGQKVEDVGTSSRVGICRGISFKWRYFDRGSPYVSRGKPSVSSHNP
jgi:DNA-3-methyladenine glycosylase